MCCKYICACYLGSWSQVMGGQPDNPELVQRSLAEANLRRFSEHLLLEALEQESGGKPLSKEQVKRLLESPEGQEAARSAALQAMLEQAPGNSNERGRGMQGWLGSMCDTIPWLAWLLPCDEDNQVDTSERENPDGSVVTQSPYIISLQNFMWATCNQDGGASSSSNEL
ncbi:hypothetical protein B566_EDAN009851 [Ephemera danica]|nr:hypothetical protein B566_EDAN009851 [Ephemera danica]